MNDSSPRPDAPPDADDPAALAAALRLALLPLTRTLRRQVEGDLTPTLMSALATVAREAPVTLGRLAAEERVSPPMATKLGNRLEERGLATRVPDPADGRVSRLEPTAEGLATLERARARRNAWLAERLDALDHDERAALVAVLPVLRSLTVADRSPSAPPAAPVGAGR